MEVLVNNRQKKVRLNLQRLRLIAEEIMRCEQVEENAELSVVLCDDEFIQKLNQEYLGKNRPTDVLSFPIEEEDFEQEVRLLGDVVISLETASRQAEKMGNSVGLEVAFLLIHGILHLLGYDHKLNKGEMMRMKQREESVCRMLGEKKLLKGIEKKTPLINRAYPAKSRLS
jgi:probable rRNA maturation factor